MVLETIHAVLGQTYCISKLYIINNASTDDTDQVIQNAGLLENYDIEYIRLNKNSGGAGGFNYGIKLAYKEQYDWIWTMDDDVEPELNCLEKLLKYKNISQCINAKKVFISNGKEQNWEQFYDYTTARMIELNNISFKNKEWCSVNVACFEGMLIHRNIVSKIGFPKKEYFLYQDDTLYGIMASYYTNVIYINNAIFKKKIDSYHNLSSFQAYYYVRNSIWLRKDIQKLTDFRQYTKWENFLFYMNITKLLLKFVIKNLSLKMLESVYKGLIDGIKK